MAESLARLAKLSRPRLLIQAARAGLARYDRNRDLSRILRGTAPVNADVAIDALLDCEAEVEERRQAEDAGYDIGRHIELLIAVMAEAQLLPRPAPRLVS